MSLRLKPYPAMKDSGVPWLGKVPEHWEVLPALAAYKPKLVKNYGMSEKTVLSLSYGRIIVKPQEKLHGLVPASFETYQIVDPGNIIVRTTDLQNDHTSLRIGYSTNRGIITSAYMCLETRECVSSEFGYQFLNAYDLLKIIYGFGSGLRQNLDFSDIKRMPVLVPPSAEQLGIVRFLDQADKRIRRFIAAKRRLIELLNEQKQAIIQKAVTRSLDPNVRFKPSGAEWVEFVPFNWQILPNQRIFSERNERGRESLPLLLVSLNTGVSIGSDVDQAGQPKRLIDDRTLYKFAAQGDLAYNMMRMWQGAVGVVPSDGLVSPAYVVVRPSRDINTKYFELLFRTPSYKNEVNRFSRGIVTDRNRLYWEDFKRLTSLIPPKLTQDAIVNYVARETADRASHN